ncbi:MAG: hypothetical protein WC393_02680 [Candidatus Nanoarchaeia archaeon]|jgi:hypothetical protein
MEKEANLLYNFDNLSNYSYFDDSCFVQKNVDKFTYKLTGMWKKMDYFGWILRNSHGVDSSTGLNDYLVWSNDSEAGDSDVCAIKKGNMVTFKHMPGHGWHNIMINTSQVLNQAICGYLLTGDEIMGKVTEQYCKGITATMKGMMYNEKDNEHFLMARNIIPESHEFVTDNGFKKAIDYDSWRCEENHWNAQRFNYPNNPYFGDVYVTNTRSKDDLPHILRAAAFLPDVILNAKHKKVANAAKEAYDYLQNFCKDVVENKFHIRTKNGEGKAYIPKGDLASFVNYGKKIENNAKLTAILLGYENNGQLSATKGYGGIYETIAANVNYYNYKIINGFHMTAILHSLNNEKNEIANKLLKGLKKRADWLMKSKIHEKARKNVRWLPDLSLFLLKAASAGMPLNIEQSNLIYNEFSKAIKKYSDFRRWNLWDSSVPDGVYGSKGGYIPKSDCLVKPIELGFFFEYAYSPYKIGNELVNTEIIKNKSKW